MIRSGKHTKTRDPSPQERPGARCCVLFAFCAVPCALLSAVFCFSFSATRSCGVWLATKFYIFRFTSLAITARCGRKGFSCLWFFLRARPPSGGLLSLYISQSTGEEKAKNEGGHMPSFLVAVWVVFSLSCCLYSGVSSGCDWLLAGCKLARDTHHLPMALR